MTRCTVAVAAALLVALGVRSAQAAARQARLRHGFRCDPMEFAERSQTVQGALVRRDVFHMPQPGDEAILEKRIGEILARQKTDGHLADGIKGTAERMLELIELGVDPKRPEVQRVAQLLLNERTDEHSDNHRHISVRGTRALVLLGITDPPAVKAAVETTPRRAASPARSRSPGSSGPWASRSAARRPGSTTPGWAAS